MATPTLPPANPNASFWTRVQQAATLPPMVFPPPATPVRPLAKLRARAAATIAAGKDAYQGGQQLRADVARVQAAAGQLQQDGVRINAIKARMKALKAELTSVGLVDLVLPGLNKGVQYAQLRAANGELEAALADAGRHAKELKAATHGLQGDMARLRRDRDQILGRLRAPADVEAFLAHASAAAEGAAKLADKVEAAIAKGRAVTDAIGGFGIFSAGDAIDAAEAAQREVKAALGPTMIMAALARQDLAKLKAAFALAR